jgi:hypothetical protein
VTLKTERVGGIRWTDFDNPKDPEFDEMELTLHFYPLAMEDGHNGLQLAKSDANPFQTSAASISSALTPQP